MAHSRKPDCTKLCVGSGRLNAVATQCVFREPTKVVPIFWVSPSDCSVQWPLSRAHACKIFTVVVDCAHLAISGLQDIVRDRHAMWVWLIQYVAHQNGGICFHIYAQRREKTLTFTRESTRFSSCESLCFAGNSGASGGVSQDRRDRHSEGTVQRRHLHTGQMARTST